MAVPAAGIVVATGAIPLGHARAEAERLGPVVGFPAARFAVDHAPRPVLLVWPEAAPGLTTMPPPPPPPHPPHHR